MSQYKPLEGCPCFHLDEPDNEPGTSRVIRALRGVCSAIEQLEEMDTDVVNGLGSAAEILSEILQRRVVAK